MKTKKNYTLILDHLQECTGHFTAKYHFIYLKYFLFLSSILLDVFPFIEVYLLDILPCLHNGILEA